MAKKIARKRGAVAESKAVSAKLSPRDKKTMGSIEGLADGVVSAAEEAPRPVRRHSLPVAVERALQHAEALLEMGSNTNRRQLFNLSQAKTYMQTMLVASGATQLIEQGKTTSIRGLFYLLKHTIEGTKEETFDDQDECDPIIEDCEVLLNSLREELHLYAQKNAATWSATSCLSTAATKSTARGWAPAATASRRSSSRR